MTPCNDSVHPQPIAIWRCSRCGYDIVEYASDDRPAEAWACEDVCRGNATHVPFPVPESDRQMDRIAIVPLGEVEHATDLAECYGETVLRIADALVADDLNDRGRIMRARGFIAGLAEQDALPGTQS